ncbi:hypothetical protein TTHERM_00521970 (macronuclear) [Tetrahymena thermophila SB210]|uniref:Transmembrane protein n=1 Tax=Tetrahymena thermophila (strain SB210) TaxID=312017 RepID=I7M128_TETTS|nr:hypothetical protein TTHERM_00521970 [Tetrahymena thermophila SB210]EAR94130.1 hypothetical protein TTHERM_00521970 [Tetrahymena thermophila SB210]|eukprot:XP_001014375.1 hypothetical protein TTHERM_00521970 [Tetrahymena thermophila SB210]
MLVKQYFIQIALYVLILQQTAYSFDDVQTVISYIGSGYLYKDPVKPNTNQLNRDQYFQRYNQLNFPALSYQNQLVHAADIPDYNALNVPPSNQDPNQSSIQQKVLVYFYNQNSQVYQSYYKYDNINNSNQQVTFLVNPCKLVPSSSCIESNTNLQDQPYIIAGMDMLVAFYTNTTILHCSDEWSKLINCGSFIEIHRTLDPYIIEQIKIEEFQTLTNKFYYFSTKKLCAGRYEIWYVVRTRIGVILQYTKPFFVSYPSCSCSFNMYLAKQGECN